MECLPQFQLTPATNLLFNEPGNASRWMHI